MRFPYVEVEFETTGVIHDPGQAARVVDLVRSAGATDVLLLAHGWNNDITAARRLYERLASGLDELWSTASVGPGRSLAVVGLLWPAVCWADGEEVAGGGVALADEAAALAAAIQQRIEDGAAAARLVELAALLETSAGARQEFLDTLRGQLPRRAAEVDDEDPPPRMFVEGESERVYDQAGGPDLELDLGGADDATGGAAGLGVGSGGVLRRARNLLNLTTYYTMKDRAGRVGATGVGDLLVTLAAGAPQVRLHLAGHSFGARVVAAAANRHQSVHSVTLLQGAFSHHGFADNVDGRGRHGSFRGVLTSGRLTGPLVITHTRNDRAVGLAYAIASRLAGHDSAGLGDASDPYGGIGSNGALRTPEARSAGELLDVGGRYLFTPGQVYNLRADQFVGSHGDVTGRQVAYALLTAMTT